MKCHAYNMFFETIANKTRLAILEALQKKPMSVTDICKSINQEQSKVSHNLKLLTECHFIDVKQKGKKRIYSLNKETIIPLMDLVKKHVEKYCSKECTRGKR
ncbi:metalloregulator ArsR/SmtB family transcription factor [Candidatus Woesearchaeota archaeon]|nr:metalloregulator ArsR/SmtB family transcription factor [Candidatus Woesearchaeota archaeon]